MVEVLMPEPIAAPRPQEIRPGIESPKPLAELQFAYDATFVVNTDAQKNGILNPFSSHYESDPRLAGITDEAKRKQAAEVLAASNDNTVKALATLDKFGKAVAGGTAVKDEKGQLTGEFTYQVKGKAVDGTEHVISETSGNAAEEYIDVVHGLKSTIAETEGSADPKQQELNKQAKEALAGIRSNVRVDTHKDGAEVEITLQEWEQQVDQKAFEMWRTDNPSVAEDAARAEFDKTSPLVRHAYQLRAETAIDAQAKYKFVYAEEKPATPQDEAAAKKEAKTAEERIQTAAEDIAPDVLRGENLTADMLKSMEGDPPLAALYQFLDALKRTQDPQQRRFLSAAVYSSLRILNSAPSSLMSEAARKNLTAFLQDATLSGEVQVMQKEFLHKFLGGVVGDEFAAKFESNPDQAFTDVALAARFIRQGVPPDRVALNLAEITKEHKINFGVIDRQLIEVLVTKGDATRGVFEANLEAMGLNVKELGDPKLWADKHAESFVDSVFPNPTEDDTQVKPQRVAAVKKQCHIDEKAVRKWYENIADKRILYGLGGIAMIFSMFQNTLGFTGEEEGGRGGPPG